MPSAELPIVRYQATVTVAGGTVQISEFEELVEGPGARLEREERQVRVFHDQRCGLQFALQTAGYRFPALAPRTLGETLGPFAFSPHADRSSEQERFRFVVPPVLTVELDAAQTLAKLEVTNAYDHATLFLYELLVGVEPLAGGRILWGSPSPGDPTIMEDSDPPPLG